MIWLGIDTANSPLSVAIVKDNVLLIEESSMMKINHSLRAMPAVEEACRKADITPSEIDAIAVSEGPGSYTGVRIGVTIAKTLAWTLDKPLYGVSSLKALAMNGQLFNGLVCSLIDARRSNVYAGVYRAEGEGLVNVLEDQHCALVELLEKLQEYNEPVLFVGEDVKLHEAVIRERLGGLAHLASFALNVPRASSVVLLAQRADEPETVHTFTPQYKRITEAEANLEKKVPSHE
ncbi:tRNA (adenosine(37)-N6)-threonylcarbamoyltransferase complex dimerization subunit type 1 TsaB [Sporosarcina sp. P26b]|uniref:tRNA (adenosine(37)-N6)-threonylcarbamoyltransferase complex dimerization subunit type 1 TsaB n=1 Tax=Sporosarcina TaxID=1569 RepID=UPI000A17F024|nr:MULTISPECIES: tRNA (adenosine(37)-N6)-threonylcarbamoyltransferase complex dimerization subunit type 1 TsaB [Sporosarcina]ARK21382.1 tRNA threonylcarbamoyladenosine biosynthesis protein TsaB [Sporosarcina ureae]PIC72547.1 tRNA (adenosine(37)-N6)-threonylcarbamoyltransferase complex dimerization subunit type 1 TsaB [Sporosarcina sp. P17b]PIC94642.1 tRNA (adenosine(37)-N6)-threonylcarbamoyltransferase complex dimerization subunit type 1 TsaB [Sporosarcina sp. P26b]